MSLDLRTLPPQGADHGEVSPVILARGAGKTDGGTDYAAAALRLYQERRTRLQAFSQSFAIFGEPAWDILLEIYLADIVGKSLCVGTACMAADVAQTTGLRWLAKLERIGLVSRKDDPKDGRRGLVKLTPRGRGEMERYFDRIVDE